MKKLYVGLSVIIVIAVAIAGLFILQPPLQRNLAPDFTLQDLNGNSFSLSDFRGNVVVIDFMATRCGPCGLQIPIYKTVWDTYKGEVIFISISVDPFSDTEETLQVYKEKFDASWIWSRDTDDVGIKYEITALPTTVIIDKNGYIKFRHAGVTDTETLIQNIEKLL